MKKETGTSDGAVKGWDTRRGGGAGASDHEVRAGLSKKVNDLAKDVASSFGKSDWKSKSNEYAKAKRDLEDHDRYTNAKNQMIKGGHKTIDEYVSSSKAQGYSVTKKDHENLLRAFKKYHRESDDQQKSVESELKRNGDISMIKKMKHAEDEAKKMKHAEDEAKKMKHAEDEAEDEAKKEAEDEAKKEEEGEEEESEAKKEAEDEADGEENHDDEEQDKKLILQMIKKHMGKDEEEECSEEESEAMHQAYEAYKEMGEEEDEAMKCAGKAMKLAKHMASKKQAEAEKCEDEAEAKKEVVPMTPKADAKKYVAKKESEIKLAARVAMLERELKKHELTKVLDKKLKESGLGRAETDKIRSLVGEPKSEEQIVETIKIFKEAFSVRGSESTLKKGNFFVTTERSEAPAKKTGKVNFSDI